MSDDESSDGKVTYGKWNHRVVHRVWPETGEHEYAIHEAHYYEGRGPREMPDAVTQNAVQAYGSTLEELRETLERMLRSLDAPVVEYEEVGK